VDKEDVTPTPDEIEERDLKAWEDSHKCTFTDRFFHTITTGSVKFGFERTHSHTGIGVVFRSECRRCGAKTSTANVEEW
jgi:hypothetical protein